MSKVLTQKQELFCQEYVKTGNATESAVKAAYAQNSANVTASKLLTNANIKNRIKELNDEIKNDNIAEAIEIQEFLTKQMRGEAKEECVVVESIGNYRSQATIIKKEITPKDRQKAAETLAKIKRLFDDTPQMPINIVINVEYE